jgi:hypothetical protein
MFKDYLGKRTVADITDFVKRHYPNLVTKIASIKKVSGKASNTAKQDSSTLYDFLAQNSEKIRIIVIKKGTNTPSFSIKSLSMRFPKTIAFATVNADTESGAEALSNYNQKTNQKNDSAPEVDDDTRILIVHKNKALADASPYAGKLAYATFKAYLLDLVRTSAGSQVVLDGQDSESSWPKTNDEL